LPAGEKTPKKMSLKDKLTAAYGEMQNRRLNKKMAKGASCGTKKP